LVRNARGRNDQELQNGLCLQMPRFAGRWDTLRNPILHARKRLDCRCQLPGSEFSRAKLQAHAAMFSIPGMALSVNSGSSFAARERPHPKMRVWSDVQHAFTSYGFTSSSESIRAFMASVCPRSASPSVTAAFDCSRNSLI